MNIGVELDEDLQRRVSILVAVWMDDDDGVLGERV